MRREPAGADECDRDTMPISGESQGLDQRGVILVSPRLGRVEGEGGWDAAGFKKTINGTVVDGGICGNGRGHGNAAGFAAGYLVDALHVGAAPLRRQQHSVCLLAEKPIVVVAFEPFLPVEILGVMHMLQIPRLIYVATFSLKRSLKIEVNDIGCNVRDGRRFAFDLPVEWPDCAA